MTDPVENKIRTAVRLVEPSPDFSKNLWNRINSDPHPVHAPKGLPRWLWIPASVVCTLTLILVMVSPQTVMAAFRSLIAYLPGIGFVQNDKSTLYLAAPVTVAQDGITLTIEQVVTDANNIVVSYRIDGSGEHSACFYDDNRLLLPDGTSRLPTGGGVSDNQARVEFAPLPAGVTRATLSAAMNFADPRCAAPQEWKVEFSLGPIPPDVKLMPVIESLATQPVSTVIPGDPAVDRHSETSDPPVQFKVDQVAILDDGYLLLGHSEWTDARWQNVRIDMESVFALDAAGKNVPLVQTDEGSKDNAFAFKIAGKDFAAPLTLQVKNLFIWADTENSATFSFTAGPKPQTSQSWDLNKSLEVAGQKITIHSVTVVRETSESDQEKPVAGYAIEISSDAALDAFILCSGQGENSESWGQTRTTHGTHKLLESYYPKGLPSGQVTCRFQDVQFQLPGSWNITWQPSSVTH